MSDKELQVSNAGELAVKNTLPQVDVTTPLTEGEVDFNQALKENDAKKDSSFSQVPVYFAVPENAGTITEAIISHVSEANEPIMLVGGEYATDADGVIKMKMTKTAYFYIVDREKEEFKYSCSKAIKLTTGIEYLMQNGLLKKGDVFKIVYEGSKKNSTNAFTHAVFTLILKRA